MLKLKLSFLVFVGLLVFSCGDQDLVSSKKLVDDNVNKSKNKISTMSALPTAGTCNVDEHTTIYYDTFGGGQVFTTSTAIPCAGSDNPDNGPLPDVTCSAIVLPSTPTNGQKNFVSNSCWSNGLTLYYSTAASAWVYPSPNLTPTGAPSSPYNGLNYQYNIPGTSQYFRYVYLTSVGFISSGWYVVFFNQASTLPVE